MPSNTSQAGASQTSASQTSATLGFERLPQQGAVELLFLLFHGVGSTAAHMRPVADRLAAEYPQAAVIGVNAPHPFDGVAGASGHQWFSATGVDDESRVRRVAQAMPAFVATVRSQQQRFGLEWGRVALVGFSQGAIMSLEAVQAEPELAGRVLAFSGRYAVPPQHLPHDTTVHIFHGMADRVLPFQSIADCAERLVALGADVTAEIEPGVGHELSTVLLDKAIEQLRTFLPKKVWREAFAEVPVLSRAASSRELGSDVPRREIP
ncbi:MAG: hypothetical protein JWP52_4508 [Rhizobacter sp.]|nr:hypothetical protein [Rhizobacter sp.]